MYTTSSQKKHWTFSNEQALKDMREAANKEYRSINIETMPRGLESDAFFLTAAEEGKLIRYYEGKMREFWKGFNPEMPPSVVGTAHHYFKRFYLGNSCMDYPPREMVLTCFYLACKVEEFNVTVDQFLANVKGDEESVSNIVLRNEFVLMEYMNHKLLIHGVYRPVEGLMIDLKTRSKLNDPERLRPDIQDFVEKLYLTDACLIYAPSRLALAAVLHAAGKHQENLDAFIMNTLLGEEGKPHLTGLITAIRNIRSMIRGVEQRQSEEGKKMEKKLVEEVKGIEEKLQKCRNVESDPNSSEFEQKIHRMWEQYDN